MRVMVYNEARGVGKSTIARHLLSSRMPGVPLISFSDSAENDGHPNCTRYSSDKYDLVLKHLLTLPDFILDIGGEQASDLAPVIHESLERLFYIDYFVVPVIRGRESERDTIKSIEMLSSAGIQPRYIRTVFNMMRKGESPDESFGMIHDYHYENASFALNPEAMVYAENVVDNVPVIARMNNTFKELFTVIET